MYPARVELLTIVFFCSVEAPLEMPPLQLENFITSLTTSRGCGEGGRTNHTKTIIDGHIFAFWKVFFKSPGQHQQYLF